MISTKNEVEHLINKILNEIYNYYESYTIDRRLCEKKIILGKSYEGSSFHWSVLLTVLKTEKFINDHRVCSLLELAKKNITNNYANFRFNYFKANVLPEDLDTASYIVRAIGELPDFNTEDFKIIAFKNSTPDGLINTWFLSEKNYIEDYFHNTSLFLNKEFYHIDVLLNFLLAKCHIENKNYIPQAVYYIQRLSMQTYWYVPSWYSYYLLGKFLYHQRLFLDEYNCLFFARVFNNKLTENGIIRNSRFANLNKIFLEENIGKNWLDRAFKLSALLNFSLSCNERLVIDPQYELRQIINYYELFNPSLYWTIGLTTFKCKILSSLFLIDCLNSIDNE